MKDLNTVIQEALKDVDFELIAKNAAVEKVKEVVESSVKDQLKSYSGFGEKLKAHINNELGFDLSVIKLPEYREFLIGAVNDSLANFRNPEQAKLISDHINVNVVGEHRDEIKFKLFWDELCEKILESCDDQDNEKYHVSFDQSDRLWSSREYWQLTISEKKDSYSSRASDQSEVMYFAFSDGVIYHSRHNDKFELSRVFTWLKALQFRGTKITDIKSNETSIPDRDY